jgi:hypothetical protein
MLGAMDRFIEDNKDFIGYFTKDHDKSDLTRIRAEFLELDKSITR